MWGTEVGEDVRLDPKKLKDALKAHDEREVENGGEDKKRKYNSLSDGNTGVTEEEMEAYRLRKSREDDPLLGRSAGENAGNGYDYV